MKFSILATAILLCKIVSAQPDKYRMTQLEYIEKYKNDAIKDMQKMGVPASITIAQGLYESESGNSNLAREANNHFGIKCHDDWTGDTFHKDDDEKNECFRKYNTVLESFDDHSAFLRNRGRYAFLFDLDITDYKAWSNGLKKAGYATNPDYARKLIKLIEDFNLSELDRKGQSLPVTASVNKIIEKTSTPSYIKPRVEQKALIPTYLHSDNDVPYVTAKSGDSYFSIANENNIRLRQVLKYNDAEKTDSPKEGEVVYIMPKKSKAKEDFHIVKEGEDMHFISQLYAVKLKKLYKRNHLKAGEEPGTGQKILLR